MEKLKLILAIAVGGALAILGGGFAARQIPQNFGGGLVGPAVCRTISSSTSFVVGGYNSLRIQATSSGRAWVIISQPNATSTIYIALANDAPASTSTGLSIGSTTPLIIGNDLRYTGAIQARASNGSTTLNVLSCDY